FAPRRRKQRHRQERGDQQYTLPVHVGTPSTGKTVRVPVLNVNEPPTEVQLRPFLPESSRGALVLGGWSVLSLSREALRRVKWFIAHLSTMTPIGAYLWLGGILLLCGLGLPIPEDISLIAAGYFSWKGVLEVNRAFAVCFAAVLAGDSLAFFMGRF